jgi:hypothetical protein
MNPVFINTEIPVHLLWVFTAVVLAIVVFSPLTLRMGA